ncbi:tetratricopeptide repeat protein [Rhodopirellula sallentina]|uniref:Transmembrane and TPR repeat-containing protein 3 n=1 Tax=Rhodopirellula sallentina SM41 TaxID=1263870 RepID=M5U2P9_9BACT|nr:tetratricopeptide repeat protein [Rhodopirellula sallentina]EMI55727.1 transmembrane and TPR repeat-containing protein 3 [Rhodopirellula sallentina SM41]
MRRKNHIKPKKASRTTTENSRVSRSPTPPRATIKWNRRDSWWAFSVIVLVFVAHYPALFSSFVFDDISFIELWLPRFDSLLAIFFPPTDIPLWPNAYYRPLGVLTLKLDHVLHGSHPFGWHLFNLMLHAAIAILVYRLTLVLLKDSRLNSRSVPNAEGIAFVSSAWFAVHPIHVESVNWIAGRSDPLATAAVLITILAFLRMQRGGNWIWIVVSATSLLAGLLTKEVAIAAVPLCLLCHLAVLVRRFGWSVVPLKWFKLTRYPLSSVAGYGVAIGVYASFRIANHTPLGVAAQGEMATIGTFTRVCGYYAIQLIPAKLPIIYPQLHTLPSLAASVLILCSFATIAIWFTRRFGRWAAFCWLGVSWCIITLAPSLMVLLRSLDCNPVSDRYLYLPSAGFCIAAVFMLETTSQRYLPAKVRISISVFFIAASALFTQSYGWHWRDNNSLWTYATTRDEQHATAWQHRAIIELKQDNLTSALEYIRIAHTLDPTNAKRSCNYSEIACRNERYQEAIEAANTAISISPDLDTGYVKKGLALLESGRPDQARELFLTAVRVNPLCSDALANLASLEPAGSLKRIELLQLSLTADPRNKMALNNLAVEHHGAGRLRIAIRCLRDALTIDPQFQLARDNLAAIERASSESSN